MDKKLIPSDEQIKIGDSIERGNNLIIDAVAGSGKTTTIFYLAKRFPQLRILTLLYNRRLCIESRKKLSELSNIDIYTIHAFSQRAYQISCHTDAGLLSIIQSDIKPVMSVSYDLLIVDEAQDLTRITASLLNKLIVDYNPSQLIMMGDHRQAIYHHLQSDYRYLTEADTLYKMKGTWDKLKLSITYRCPSGIVDFINNCVLKNNIFKSYHQVGGGVIYIRGNMFPGYKSHDLYNFALGKQVFSLIKKYPPDQIAILAPSLRSSNNPVSYLINYLSTYTNYKIYKPSSDDEDLKDESLHEGKIIASTIHQFKGRERKVIILSGFDKSYFEYYGREYNSSVCPNIIYVALTRAIEKLILLEHKGSGTMDFVDTDLLPTYTHMIDLNPNGKTKKQKNNNANLTFSVSQMVKHLPYLFIEELKQYYTVQESTGKDSLALGRIIKFECYEDVSSIIGSLIPFIRSIQLGKKNNLIISLQKYLNDPTLTISKSYKDVAKSILMKPNWNYEEIGYMINLYHSCQDRSVHLLKQIKHYEWINEELDEIWKGVKRLEFITSEYDYEIPIQYDDDNIKISGAIDCLSEEYMWELKCVNHITDEHILQLVIYACIDTMAGNKRIYKLYNIMNDQSYEIKLLNVDKIMELLINHKMRVGEIKIDIKNLFLSKENECI